MMLGSGGGEKGNSTGLIRERARRAPRVLIVGSPVGRAVLAAEFERLGFDVCTGGVEVGSIWSAANLPANLVVVDFRVQSPHLLQWCRSFRASSAVAAVPLIAITTPEQVNLRLELLAGDIEDCLVGPKLSEESVLRIRALLRRASLPAQVEGELHYADIVLDPTRLKVWRNGVRVPLSMLQFQVLQVMMMSPGKVFSRAELRRLVWGDRPVEDVAIIKCMSRLGQSLNADGGSEIIRRTRSGGYSLDVEAGNISGPS
jgi:two-component system phosphate regulon response regulator PhoB